MPKLPRKLQSMIAKEILRIKTLEERGRDSLDFHDLGVNTIKEALLAAYLAGMKDYMRKSLKPAIVVKGFGRGAL